MSQTQCTIFDPSIQAVQVIPCNNVVGSANIIFGEVIYNYYGYKLLDWPTYLFLALNVLAFIVFVGQGIYWRQWWTIGTLAMGALVETVGWGGRLWSNRTTFWSPDQGGGWDSAYGGFIMQICCLVIAPTFYAACNYALLGKLVRVTGGRYLSVTPRSEMIVFVTVDIVCLVIQGVGGGLAGSGNTDKQRDDGAYIMTGGVCVQLAATLAFSVLYGEFLYRFIMEKPARRQINLVRWLPGKKNKETLPVNTPSTPLYPEDVEASKEIAMTSSSPSVEGFNARNRWILPVSAVLGFTTLLIIIRGVFRSVELTDGWVGPIATNQPLFLALDPLLMGLLAIAYMVFHPGLALGRR